MIIFKTKKITDPSLIPDSDIGYLREGLISKNVTFLMPDNIISNKEKTEYKSGFLNEVYLKVFPELLKKTIFEEVSKRFDIFVDQRQYQNLVYQYNIKKYLKFIKPIK